MSDTFNKISLNDLKILKEQYYSQNGGKNKIFKEKQKQEIATFICQFFPIEMLVKNTIFRIKNTNTVYIDYTMFKIFANPNNYEYIVNHIFNMLLETIEECESMVIRLNMDTISISATERFKDILHLFNRKCVNTQFINKLNEWCIYNTPLFVESYLSILKIIIDPNILHNLKMYDKIESPQMIQELLENHYMEDVLNNYEVESQYA